MTVLLLFLAGLVLILCELFIPGGILGVIGVVSIGGSIFFAFEHYPDHALLIAVGELIGLGAGVLVGVRIFPHTPIARVFTLRREFDAEEGFTSAPSELASYVGKEGVAATTLRPVGIALIEGARVNVVTDGEFIEKDARVRVAEVEGSRVVVRPVAEPGQNPDT